MKSLITLPLAAWIWRPCASRFPFSREIWQVILRFVGQPSTAGSNTTGPAQILTSGPVFQHHNAGRLLVLDLMGKSMACVCWQVQRQGYYDFAPVAGRQQPRAWNADRGVPDRDEAGGLRRWHCTTVENGLRIMRDGRMRVLPGRVNYPQGIYSAKSPANTYDIGCQVGWCHRLEGCGALTGSLAGDVSAGLDRGVGPVGGGVDRPPRRLRDRGDPVPLRDAADVPRADAAGLADADAAHARRATKALMKLQKPQKN